MLTPGNHRVPYAARATIVDAVRLLRPRSVNHIKALEGGVMEAQIVTVHGKVVTLQARQVG